MSGGAVETIMAVTPSIIDLLKNIIDAKQYAVALELSHQVIGQQQAVIRELLEEIKQLKEKKQ